MTSTIEVDDDKWNVQLRDDQMNCVIECLTYLRDHHDRQIKGLSASDHFSRFAHQQSRSYIDDVLKVFTAIR